MKYGFVMSTGDAADAARLAAAAEKAGWDGFFVWEPVWGVDAWVSLTAAAMRTERIRLGTMLTPPSRRRPWKLASEIGTLDRLSNGRVTLTVGLGALDSGFADFGEETDKRIRAELLDEGLAIITGLGKGQPFSFSGKHYKVKESKFVAPPPNVQNPIPIWVVGAWKRPKSMDRAVQYQGILPQVIDGTLTPQHVREVREYLIEVNGPERGSQQDIVVEGETPGDNPTKAREIVHPWADAGATWWIEGHWQLPPDMDPQVYLQKRIEQGPPPVR
jgi:alkanesulfonate monooxygenase SsuD/methylene tetrahydromethanopterin reductase-like flavin-dependent oxidoreductase (luciferase family)